jgi:hypothetical protein
VALHVVVADRDVVADHLPDPHLARSLGGDDHDVSRAEVRLHAAREHRLGPVPTEVRQEPEQNQGQQREGQEEAREHFGNASSLPGASSAHA